jgi:hypothetical protein
MAPTTYILSTQVTIVHASYFSLAGRHCDTPTISPFDSLSPVHLI